MRTIVILSLMLLVFGCKHDEEVKLPLGPVFAGIVGKDMVYYAFVPDLDLDTLPVAPAPGFNVNQTNLDLNRDKIADIMIMVFQGDLDYAGITFLPWNTQTNKIGFSCSEISVSLIGGRKKYTGKVAAIDSGRKINSQTCEWSLTNFKDENNQVISNTNYTYKLYADLDTLNWQPIPNQYIGFRFIENTDTLYGWMRVSVMGKAHLVVHDCAYQKR